MYHLSFDILSNNISIAIFLDNKILTNHNIEQPSRHSELLISAIEETLQQAQINYRDLKIISTTTSPGSFTSCRISQIVANIMRLSLNIPVLTLDKSDVVAWKYRKYCHKDIMIALNYNAAEFYLSNYLAKDNYLVKNGNTEIITIEQLVHKIINSNKECIIDNKELLLNFNPKINNQITPKFIDVNNNIEASDIAFYANFLYSNNMINESDKVIYLREPNIF